MKTKYLFYSLAIAGAFTACSQEELVEAPVAENNVANRPVAGVVEFSTEGVESRYNHETTAWDNGDIFGLYLMDEYNGSHTGCQALNVCPGEHNNANQYETKKLNGVVDPINGYSLWAYQDHWFNMYQFTNSIQSNYPFRATVNGDKVTWKNDAKLVEGNYFAMYPQNDKALNRRELWHEIDPSVTLKKHSRYDIDRDKYFVNLDNQFFLGYKQILRNETASAEGVMKMDVNLRGAMVPINLKIIGWSDHKVKLDKVEFKSASGNALPTIAYIEPATYQDGDWTENKTLNGKEYYYEEPCKNEFHGIGLYSEDKTWTRSTIQNLISWEVPMPVGDRLPYGCDAKPAYEYTFAFPGSFEDKVVLRDETTDIVNVYFALPAKMGKVNDVYATVYGWVWIPEDNNGRGRWEYGILKDNSLSTQAGVNSSFNLDATKLNSWTNANGGSYFLTIQTSYDNYGWVTVDQAKVSNTEEMNELIKGRVLSASSLDDIKITVQPDAQGVEVEKELVDWLKDASEDYKSITITFDGARHGVVYFNDDNTMYVNAYKAGVESNVKFIYLNNIQLINNATQNVYAGLTTFADTDITNEKDGTLNFNYSGAAAIVDIVNKGTMNVSGYKQGNEYISKVWGTVTNQNVLNLSYAEVSKISNAGGTTTVTNNSLVEDFVNTSRVGSCGSTFYGKLFVNGGTMEAPAFLTEAKTETTVAAAGVIDFTGDNPTNGGKLTNNGTIKISTKSTDFFHNHGDLINAGKIASSINRMENKGKIENTGTIEVAGLVNEGTIDEKGGKILYLENHKGAILNIWSENSHVLTNAQSKEGEIIFKGVPATGVALNNSNDFRIFETQVEGEGLISLMTKMQPTAATELRITKNIVLDWDSKLENSILAYRNKITKMNVVNSVTIKSQSQNQQYSFNKAKLVVKDKANVNDYDRILTIDNVLKLFVYEVEAASVNNLDIRSNSIVGELKTGGNTYTHHTSNVNTGSTVTGGI